MFGYVAGILSALIIYKVIKFIKNDKIGESVYRRIRGLKFKEVSKTDSIFEGKNLTIKSFTFDNYGKKYTSYKLYYNDKKVATVFAKDSIYDSFTMNENTEEFIMLHKYSKDFYC